MRGRSLDKGFRLLGLLLVGVVICFLLIPIIVTAMIAFDSRSFLGPLPPPTFSLRWFREFFSDAYYLRGLVTSILLALGSVAISLSIGVVTAFTLNRASFVGKEALTSLFLSPLIVPPVVTGFALLLFLSQMGIFNGFVRLFCGHIIITIPYTIRATLESLSGIDLSFREAALNLGATERRAFWDITFPLARTGIVAGGIFAFAVSMDDVAVALMLTDAHNYTLPVALVSNMRGNFNLTLAAASLMLMLVTLVLIFVLEKFVGLNRIVGQGVYRL
jgi:putative spermidine/putrescine transport system permease protein